MDGPRALKGRPWGRAGKEVSKDCQQHQGRQEGLASLEKRRVQAGLSARCESRMLRALTVAGTCQPRSPAVMLANHE